MQRQWILSTPDEKLVSSLSDDLGISPVTARIIANRGISSLNDAKFYLDPSLKDIPDPFKLSGMNAAVQRIIKAIRSNEKIGIFGDYDVDGVTGTALLARFLKTVNVSAVLKLPSRHNEGYGISKSDLDDFLSAGVKLIVTVDNGTRAIDEMAYAAKIELDVIITDHHKPSEDLPKAVAIVNPKLDGIEFLNELAGCGVVFMLVMALRKNLRGLNLFKGQEPNLREHLDLVALGTVADIVPLSGINRLFVKHGLVEIATTTKVGIKALAQVAGIKTDDMSPYSISFGLAPRINAAGRMGEATGALELLLSDDPAVALNTARVLNLSNKERQKTEEKIIDEIIEAVSKDTLFEKRSSIVLASENWHVGVIGIAASKIAQRFSLPTIIISKGTLPARGSARSISGLDILDALSKCESHLVKFGGHEMAAGLAIEENDIQKFTDVFDNVCKNAISVRGGDKLFVDAKVSCDDLTQELVKEIMKCRPFGIGNSEPVLVIENATITSRRVVGTNHLKLKVKKDGKTFDAIAFGKADLLPADAKNIALAFCPEFNTWNGETTIQLKVRDFKF